MAPRIDLKGNGEHSIEFVIPDSMGFTKQRDRAVIVVTHDHRVFEFGDRIVSLSDGQIESVEVRSRTAPGAAPSGGVSAS